MTSQSLLQRAVEKLGPDGARALFRTDAEREAAAYIWELVARPSQLPPPSDWDVWLILSGRGWGKTWTGGQLDNSPD